MTQTFSSSGIYGLLSKIAHGLLLRTALWQPTLLPSNNFPVDFLSPLIIVSVTSANLFLFYTLLHEIKFLYILELPDSRRKVIDSSGVFHYYCRSLNFGLSLKHFETKFLLIFKISPVRPVSEHAFNLEESRMWNFRVQVHGMGVIWLELSFPREQGASSNLNFQHEATRYASFF
jgi:hypothetical protein